jgi:pilus assembly protein CpaE
VQPLRALADAILATDGEREAAPGGKAAKGMGKGAKAAPADADGAAVKSSGSVLGRSIKKLLSAKSKTGVPA